MGLLDARAQIRASDRGSLRVQPVRYSCERSLPELQGMVRRAESRRWLGEHDDQAISGKPGNNARGPLSRIVFPRRIMTESISLEWVSHGRKARCQPNPDYPGGVEVNLAGDGIGCEKVIPYPAPECGVWVVRCERCGASTAITAAGRSDDPKQITLACKAVGVA